MLNATTAVRIVDTRPNKITNGQPGAGPIQPDAELVVPVLGRGGVPLSGVAAVTGILTAIPTSGPSSGGYMTVYPSGRRRPTASNVNFGSGITANQFTCPVGPDGAIKIYDGSAVNLNLALDLNGWIAQPSLEVTPPAGVFPTPFASVDVTNAVTVLRNANRYAMGPWWAGPAQTLLAANMNNGVANNDAIRRLSMQAFSTATALATAVYDPVDTGVDVLAAAGRVTTMVDRVASQHLANHLDGWGEDWQTAMWAGICGRAAWFLWDAIPDSTRRLVAAMVECEANWAVRYPVKYYRNPAGTIINPGDSGAEEVSWNCEALQVALVMFPNHPNWRVWQAELCRFSLAAWARPSDLTNNTVVNGRTVAQWIAGSNVNQDGTVDNHARPASDYATCTYQNLNIVPLYLLAGWPIPEACRALLGPVYAAHRGVVFTSPPWDAPGGTTYVDLSSDIYYPRPCDWGPGQRIPYLLADAQAWMYGYSSGGAWDYMQLHMAAQLGLQARHPDGHTYASPAESNYPGTEEHVAQQAAQLYLSFLGGWVFHNDPV